MPIYLTNEAIGQGKGMAKPNLAHDKDNINILIIG